MEWKKLVMLISVCSILVACKNYYHHVDGGYRPKKPKFTSLKKPYKLKKEDILNTKSIYISTDTLEYGNKKYKSLFFIKFYNNGRSFQSSIDAKINVNEQKLTPTYIGYYTINKGNLLEIETFYVKHKEKGVYIKEYGWIKQDTLFMFKSLPKRDMFPNPDKSNSTIYVLKKVESLSEIPDW